MHVYIVFHLHETDGYSICHVCCTKDQAEKACAEHPPAPGWTFGWKAYKLEGFPYLWLAFGIGLLLALVVTRLL